MNDNGPITNEYRESRMCFKNIGMCSAYFTELNRGISRMQIPSLMLAS